MLSGAGSQLGAEGVRVMGRVVGDGGKLDATSQHVTRQVTRYAIARDLAEVDRQWHTPLNVLQIISLYKLTNCFSNHASWGALHGFKVFSIDNNIDNIETGVSLYSSWSTGYVLHETGVMVNVATYCYGPYYLSALLLIPLPLF